MSQNERHKGTLTYIGEYDEAKAIERYKEKYPNLHFDEYDYLYEFNLYKDGDKLYQIDDTEYEGDYYFSEMKEIGPGKYEYHMMFYNGGTCLGEMLDDELSKLNK